MLTEVCEEIRNYFIASIHHGKYEINGGSIAPLDFLQQGQYFRIVGSTMNDGVYQYPCSGLADETFVGAVWAMTVPPAVVALSAEIKEYCDSEQAKPSAYTSESFGGYSYSKATDSNGVPLTWQKVFANRLNRYRRISVL